MMEPKEAAKYHTWCHENGIRVYPIPYGSSNYKIVINKNGKEKIGNVVYKQFPEPKDLNIWDAIQNLLKQYFDLNFNLIPKNNLKIQKNEKREKKI